LRFRAAIAVLTLLLVASLQGCGTDESREGPPFEPDNIESPESLLITNSDVEGVGGSTPYGAVFRWWHALQRGDVEEVRRSYARRVSRGEAKRDIDRLQPRTSQPIDPEVQTQGNRARVQVVVRAANPLPDTPSVVAITDFKVSFSLVRKAAGWRVRPGSFRRYLQRRKAAHLAGVD
jgi:hypothetical protein